MSLRSKNLNTCFQVEARTHAQTASTHCGLVPVDVPSLSSEFHGIFEVPSSAVGAPLCSESRLRDMAQRARAGNRLTFGPNTYILDS